MKFVYPWSAVVGQDALKRALLLCAIDPAIGGVMIQGPRGVAKTTLARALAELVTGAFVELPLGASEERVTGTLDLGAALRAGEIAFQPGLLARAHEGVLYVDEVNLLPDALVDVLLDAAASGRNVIERDGISHEHAARFVLVGTMNPEEGELRPQLSDRFGLSVQAEGANHAIERAEIVLRRLAFDAEPEAFRARFALEQHALIERCQQARARLAMIPLDAASLARVTERCHAAGVEGVRADLAMLRAARAHAAWHGRDAITDEDIEAVAELALAHRRRTGSPPSSSGPRGQGNDGGPKQGTSSPPQGPPPAGADGALRPVPVRTIEATLPPQLVARASSRPELQRRGTARVQARRGRRASVAARGHVDWFATLARTPRPTLDSLRYRARRAPSAELWVIALDCSASMLRSGSLARAKGVVAAFERAALRRGARLAVLGFQGGSAKLAIDTGMSRGTRLRAIDALGGGGGTPLLAALRTAQSLCTSRRYADGAHKRVVLITDGRTRESVGQVPLDAEPLVIDCERGPVRLGGARKLADALHAPLVHLDALR
jgi:magnesium chelatase subunit D